MTNFMNHLSNIGYEAFELIWENTIDAIFILGKDGAIIHANPTFTEILGWEIEDIQGITPPPFFHNLSREQHEAFLNKLRRGEKISYSVVKRKSKDGEILDILATYRPINKGEILAIGMYKDFTEQMDIQRQLEASEDCYRNLVEFLPDAIIVQNRHHIVFVNPAGVKLLGQNDAKSLIGKSIWNFIYSENKASIENELIEMMNIRDISNKAPIIEKIIRFDYKTFYMEITAIPIVYNRESVMQILFRDITEQKTSEKQLEYLANHDPLTGLVNRRSFIEAVDHSIDYASNMKERIALFYIDMDKFKEVNDSLGHDIGDEILKKFGKRLVENVRGNSVHCRIGGDEFLVLIKDIDNKWQVSRIAERLIEALQKPYWIKGHNLSITASIGIAMYPQNGINSKSLIKHADEALYKAKVARNNFEFYS
jgi:diguanylate cyclase (GGDEF)-like protein/PAS domain S-box-containing protein